MEDASWFLFMIAFSALIYAWVIERRRRRDVAASEEKFKLVVTNLELLEQRLRIIQSAAPATPAAMTPAPEIHILPQPKPLQTSAATAAPQSICAKCGATIAASAQFCTRCGTAVPGKPLETPPIAAEAHATASPYAPLLAPKPVPPAVTPAPTPVKPAAIPPAPTVAPPPPPAPPPLQTRAAEVVPAPTHSESKSTPAPAIAAPHGPPPPPQRPAIPAFHEAAASASPAPPRPPMPGMAAPAAVPAKTTLPAGRPMFSSAVPPAPKKRSRSFEEMLGIKLLPVIGIAIVVLGVGFLVGASWGIFPHWLRVLILYAGGLALLAGGISLEKKNRYTVLGRSLIGGGWAVSALVTYAIANAAPLQVLDSKNVDLFLLLAVIGAMVWHTLKYNSQVVTGIAFLLGFVAIGMNPSAPYNLIAGAMLIAGMIVIVVRRQWFEMEIVGILASYANHFYWLYGVYERQGARTMFPYHSASVALVIGYWAIFRASYLIRKISGKEQESVSTFAALLNPILFLAVMKYQGFHPEWAWWLLLAMGAMEFTLGQSPVSRRRRAPFLALSSLGVALMAASPLVRGSGNALEVIWLAGAETFLVVGIFMRERLFRAFGLIISFLVALYALGARIVPLAQQMANGQPHHQAQTSLVLAVIAAALYANAHITRRRWPNLFEHEVEQQSLTFLSYAGSLFAAAAVYAYVPEHATAAALVLLVAALSRIGQRLAIAEMIYEAHWIAVAAFIQVVAIDRTLETAWLRMPHRVMSFGVVAALLYLSSRFVRLSETRGKAFFSGAYAWAGTSLLTLLIWFQAKDWAVAVLWIVLGLALSVVAQFWKRNDLKWQAFALVLISSLASLVVVLSSTTTLSSDPKAFLSHVTYRLLSVSLVALGVYLLARWAPREQMRPIYTVLGTLLLTLLAYREAPAPWTAVTWIALALALSAATLKLKQEDLKWQALALVLLAFGRTLLVNFDLPVHSIALRLVPVSLTALGTYLLARWAPLTRIRPVYSGIGTVLLALLVYREAPVAWTAVSWIALALALSGAALLFKQEDLKWQAFLLAVLAFARTLQVNFGVPGAFHSISLRLISVSLAALGIYVLARWAPLRQMRPLYSVAGTFLLGYLAFMEAPAPWAAVLWIGLALALALAARWWKDRSLLWQTHLLAALATGWTLYLFYDPRYSGTRAQWVTVGITAAALYALTWLTKISAIIEDERICQAYAWAGSLLVSWLAWYQLPPNLVALAWGMFALLLFEFPELARAVKIDVTAWAAGNWRVQAYVALGGSFVRIFIANFNVVGWGPAAYAALLVPIYFYVYWQLGERETTWFEKNIQVEFVMACLGTATLAALARFELADDAVVIGYAGLVVGTLLVAWLAHRQTFLFQALVMLGVTGFRIAMTNFYGLNKQFGSSLSDAMWAIGLLACAVPLAFQARKNAEAENAPRWFNALALHAEQPVFFVPVVLLAVLLFLKLSGSWVTLAWATEGAAVFILALWAKERSFRWTGLTLLLPLTIGKLAYDTFYFNNPQIRYLTWIGVGILILVVAFLYGKYRDALREYL